jgi:hypothetical protein
MYETLILNKTSMLKKTISDMNGMSPANAPYSVDFNLPHKKNESRNMIPKPSTKSSTRKPAPPTAEQPPKKFHIEMMTPKTSNRQ